MKRVLVSILLVASLFQVTIAVAQPPPPLPQKAQITEIFRVEQAIRQAIFETEISPIYLIYETFIDHITISKDGKWAFAWLNPIDPETHQVVPAEPGLALVRREGEVWRAILPANPKWESSVQAAPADLLSSNSKVEWLGIADENTTEGLSAGPLGGYLLPWAAGETMYLTQSVHHDKYDASGKGHYSFDFAKPGYPSDMFNLYASKAGTVHHAVWWHPDHNEQYGNYLILKDTTTTPTSYQLYLHLSQDSIPPALREEGASVVQGQFIGIADDTGISSGNHLHFMVHLNPDSYWGQSVDITFNDVDINGGRPRNAEDLAYCVHNERFNDICDSYRNAYISGNTVKGDVTPPVGDILAPQNGITVMTETLHLEGWASDQGSGIYSAQFIANYDDAWREIGTSFNTNLFSLDWNLCSNQVPDGPISLALKIQDKEGNRAVGLPGLRHFIKSFSCPSIPPACAPTQDQVALFANPDFDGSCVTLGIGSYNNSASLGNLGVDNAVSILVGANVRATLYIDDLQGRGETFPSRDANLADNRIGADTVSSVSVQGRATHPSTPVTIWPTSVMTFTAGSSLSLVWDDGGGGEEFNARLVGPGGTITSTWMSETAWHLGSLAAGYYTWQVKARNDSGESDWSQVQLFNLQPSTTNFLNSPTITAPYTDTMESGVNGWIASNYWDQTNSKNHTQGGQMSWKYDTGSPQGYDTGAPNSGDLTSPPIQIPSEGTYYLRFWYQYETEGPGVHWDQRWVQISVDGGPFTNTLQLFDDPPNYWLQSPALDLSTYAGSTIQVRFHFETLDAAFNTFAGWFIDDFSISTSPPPTCKDTDNTPAQAALINYGATGNGTICPAGDVDFYRFPGHAGEQLGISVESKSLGSQLDSIVFLLDSDGQSVLVENDDEIYGVHQDSFLTYRLLRDGTYYVKLRAWDHPSSGGAQYTYRLKLNSDNTDPVAKITSPPGGTFLPNAPFTITATATDSYPGVRHMEFLWHSDDWQASDWILLGKDWNGADGWSFGFDPTSLPDQKDIAFFMRAYDWAGNWTGAAIWDMKLDQTPPVTSMKPLSDTQDSTAFLLHWSGTDNLAGIDHFDLQRKKGTGQWKDFSSSIPAGAYQTWVIGDIGTTYGFRLRGVDKIGNTEAYPTSSEATTSILSADIICSAADPWETPGDNQITSARLITQTNTSEIHNFCLLASPDRLNDEDWLKFSMKAGQLLQIESLPQSPSAATVLELFNSDLASPTLLTQSTPTDFGQASRLFWLAPHDSVVYLRMRHLDGRVIGNNVTYQVLIRQGLPTFLPTVVK